MNFQKCSIAESHRPMAETNMAAMIPPLELVFSEW
jgi:hypothetical protein